MRRRKKRTYDFDDVGHPLVDEDAVVRTPAADKGEDEDEVLADDLDADRGFLPRGGHDVRVLMCGERVGEARGELEVLHLDVEERLGRGG